MTGGETHKVVNQSPPYGGINLFETDPLVNAAASGFPDSVRQDLSEAGLIVPSVQMTANVNLLQALRRRTNFRVVRSADVYILDA